MYGSFGPAATIWSAWRVRARMRAVWIQRQIELAPRPRGFHLVTDEIVERRARSCASSRWASRRVFMQHTSASLTLNENACPDVRRDFAAWFDRAVPDGADYFAHTLEGPDDMPAHIKASLTGTSLTIPVSRRPARARHLAGHLPLRAPRLAAARAGGLHRVRRRARRLLGPSVSAVRTYVRCAGTT